VPALTVPSTVAALLLVLAGAGKVVDPTMTVGALRAMRLPAAPWAVRGGSLVEIALGMLAVTVGGAVLWWAVALSYLAFGAFVFTALRRGTMIGSCGCFGRDETPPHAVHVVLDLGLVSFAALTAVVSPGAPVDAITDAAGTGVALVTMTAVALFLLYAAFVELPRALVPSTDWARASSR
jgi:hypothetical protein